MKKLMCVVMLMFGLSSFSLACGTGGEDSCAILLATCNKCSTAALKNACTIYVNQNRPDACRANLANYQEQCK